jgi:hypothetical protein
MSFRVPAWNSSAIIATARLSESFFLIILSLTLSTADAKYCKLTASPEFSGCFTLTNLCPAIS